LPSVLTSNLSQDATLVQGLLGTRMGLSVQNVVTIIAGLVIAFDAGWKLTLVLLAMAPAMLFASVMEMLSFKGLGQKSKKATSQANQIATEAIGNIR
jgi:ATP-binding cassette subfamily B (MDR/TAP) protein 1